MRMMTRKKKEENHMAPGWVKEFRAVTLNLQGLSLPSKVTPSFPFCWEVRSKRDAYFVPDAGVCEEARAKWREREGLYGP